MTDPLAVIRFRDDLHTHLRRARRPRKALAHTLRAALETFSAQAGAAAVIDPGREEARVVYSTSASWNWDLTLLGRYLRGERPAIPHDLLLAPVTRRGRNWSVLALQRDRGPFSLDESRAYRGAIEIVSDLVGRIDEERVRTLRRRISRKVADRQEPKDILYDILHGLRSLTRYDHSGAVLVAREDSTLELVAEQIAWTKAKSRSIGKRVAVDPEELARLDGARIFLRDATGLHVQNGADPLPGLRAALELDGSQSPSPARTVLCVPLLGQKGPVGLLRVAAGPKGELGDYEADQVAEFAPLASLMVQLAARTESLEARMLAAERKHVMANLSRAIAHDVNNALGAMLPLVQQLREDIHRGEVRTVELEEDLRHIESSLQVCRRIFGAMLTAARSSNPRLGQGNLRRAIDAAQSMLHNRLRQEGVEFRLDLADELPSVQGGQGDLTQLLFNLCTNAVDAMPEGGVLSIHAHGDGDAIGIEIQDTGVGIPPGILERILEPFVTTKATGQGLGLAVCRSIVSDLGGTMSIESQVDQGTRIRLRLPVRSEGTKTP